MRQIIKNSSKKQIFAGQTNQGDEPLWHAMTSEEAITRIDGYPQGLSDAQANERRQVFGSNTVVTARPDSAVKLLIRQLNSPLLFVLLGSGSLALALGKLTDGAVVLGVVLLNALIGFLQEYKAQKAINALGQMIPHTATVRRNQHMTTIDATTVVPGDIVMLQSGDRVPADIRLISVKNLQLDESSLTGESVSVSKHSLPVARDTELADRLCMVYGGTMVTAGTGLGIVTATGNQTELGKISHLLSETSALTTPLIRSIGRVSLWLTYVILGVTALLFVIAWMRGYAIADATIAAISLAVAAIPEGLPAIITITLAIGVKRMAARRVIIRSLPAVETLGSTTVICSDKTGTLTKNQMTVQLILTNQGEYRVSGRGYQPDGELSKNGRPIDQTPDDVMEILQAGALCNDSYLRHTPDGSYLPEGDPTEVALLVAARKVGLDEKTLDRRCRRIDTIPFESEHRIMATLHTSSTGSRIFIKGAPEEVIQRCMQSLDRIDLILEKFASEGLRILAMASKELREPVDRLEESMLQEGFHLLGMQGMLDPPRMEAIEAVNQCRLCGIKVKMITGDHAATAVAIGNQLGLQTGDSALTGKEIASMSEQNLVTAAASSTIFARVAPEHKLRLVKALQSSGEIVAMTGDGVNDAPALMRADIGVAMGITGTAVSRQAADMVLTDDNFASIVAAVEEGRRVFDNLIKSLVFVLPTNIGEALIVLAAILFFPIEDGQPLMPILPVQILWVNLVATVSLALPLAFEAKEPDIMVRPPRSPQKPLLDAFVLTRTFYVAMLMTVGAIGLFLFELRLELQQGAHRPLALAHAQTSAVTAIIAFQVFYLLTCRSLQQSIRSIGMFTNPTIFLGIGSIMLMQVGFVHLPWANQLFGSAPLDFQAWLRALLVGVCILPIVAIEKSFRKPRHQSVPSHS